jgi:hypothetical protein
MFQAEVVHAIDGRNDDDIRNGEGVAQQPRPRVERRFHAPQRQIELIERGGNFFRRKAASAHAAVEMLADRSNIRVLATEFLFVQRLETVRERLVKGRHADRRRGHLLEKAHPGAHARPFHRIGGRQRVPREHLVEIFAYDARIDDDLAVMEQRRHDAIGVQLEISGRQMFVGPRVHLVTDPIELLLRQTDANLLAAGGDVHLIEFDHRNPPRNRIARPRY